MNRLKNFLADDSGAITVDWIVLTAAIVGFLIFVMGGVIRESLIEASTHLNDRVASAEDFLK